MTHIRKTLTEQEATSYFVRDVTKGVKDAWPTIRKEIIDISSQLYSEELSFKDEEMAAFDFALAVIAQDLEAATNLYNKEQASRIEELVLRCFKYKDEEHKELGEYAVEEIKAYRNKLHTDSDPLYAISIRLLQRLLGKKYNLIIVNVEGKSCIDPIILSMINPLITCCCGFWKTTKDNYELIKDELPKNEDRKLIKNISFSSLASSYVKILRPHYDELFRLVSSIDRIIDNPSAIGIFIAHMVVAKIKISHNPNTDKIIRLFLNKWMRYIISIVPSTDKCTTAKQWFSDFERTFELYIPRLIKSLKSDISEEDRYNEILYLTADLHIEALGEKPPKTISSVPLVAQVVHRVALDVFNEVHVPIENNYRSSFDDLKIKVRQIFTKDDSTKLIANDRKSKTINTSSGTNPIKLFRPSNYETAAAKSLAVFKASGKFPQMNELPSETFTGMFSEMVKMSWLETKLGRKNNDYTLGEREYLKGTSIQKQIVILKNGETENYYFDFSSFGEIF